MSWASLQRHPLFRALLVGLGCMAVSVFFYSPAFWLWGQPNTRLDDLAKLATDPLDRTLTWPFLAYRVTTPLIAWLVHLRDYKVVIVAYAANVLSFSILYLALKTRLTERVSILLCVALSMTHTMVMSNVWWHCPDSVTNLMSAIVMLSSSPLVVVLASALGFLNDERFFLAIPFLILWHSDKRVKVLLWLAAGVLIAMSVRHALTVGLVGPGIHPEAYRASVDGMRRPMAIGALLGLSRYLIGSLMAFRWVWLIPVMAARQTRSYGVLALLLAGCAIAAIVADVSRGVAMMFPAVCVAACHLENQEKWLKRSILLCAITPQGIPTEMAGSVIGFIWPLPLALIRWWFGIKTIF